MIIFSGPNEKNWYYARPSSLIGLDQFRQAMRRYEIKRYFHDIDGALACRVRHREMLWILKDTDFETRREDQMEVELP